jgi:hypothetical protein
MAENRRSPGATFLVDSIYSLPRDDPTASPSQLNKNNVKKCDAAMTPCTRRRVSCCHQRLLDQFRKHENDADAQNVNEQGKLAKFGVRENKSHKEKTWQKARAA